jgi:arylsulfatase A-like enzyme
VPRRYFDLYDVNSLTLPVVRVDDLDDVPLIPRRWVRSRPDHDLVTGGDQWRPAVHAYLAAISFCDHMVGRMVAALDASGHAGSTSVVLWGDNGFHLGEKLHWRKFVLWEEATRVPLVILEPGGPRQRPRVHLPVSLIDLHPTVLDLCGLGRDAGADGSSLLALMNGRATSRPPAVMTWGRGNHSVRMAGWRLTRYADGTAELFDHETDPHEWTNLASDARFDDVRRSLSGWLPED